MKSASVKKEKTNQLNRKANFLPPKMNANITRIPDWKLADMVYIKYLYKFSYFMNIFVYAHHCVSNFTDEWPQTKSQKKCLLLCDAWGGMTGIPFSGGTSLISLSGGIWILHSGVLTLTSKRSAHHHVRGTLLSGTWLTRPSVIEAVLWSDIYLPTHTNTHSNVHAHSSCYLKEQQGCWCWNTCMDHWRGALKRFLFQKKTWYKRKDKGTDWVTSGPPTLTGAVMRRDHPWQVFCLTRRSTMWPL